MKPVSATRDILRVLLTAAAFIAGYSALIEIKQPRLFLAGLPDGDRNEIIAERYLYERTPHAVLVGSSMSRRLGFGDESNLSEEVYNLGLDGGAPITGVALIAAKRAKPCVVLVETNWLRRPLDKPFLEQVAGTPQYYFKNYIAGLRREYTPMALLLAAIDGRINPAPSTPPTSIPGTTVDAEPDSISRSLRYTLERFGQTSAELSQEIDQEALVLSKQIARLQAAGVHVVLVDLPMHPALESSPAFEATRSVMEKTFPKDRFDWLSIADRASYHTVDTIHLTGTSAQRLSLKIIEAAEMDRCKAPLVP